MSAKTIDFNKTLDAKILVIFHAVILIALIFASLTVMPKAYASAETELSCSATNLADQLAKKDPETYQAALDEAAKTINSKGLLWKIEKDNAEPSYLFGTMHVTDPRILAIPETAQMILDQSDIVVIETLGILDPQEAQATVAANPGLANFTDGTKLSDKISDADKALVSSALAEKGIPLEAVETIKPWVLMSLVASPQCETQRKQQGKPILDLHLVKQAQKAGKNIDQLETLTEQLSAMSSLPIDFQIRGLVETINFADHLDDVMETMTALYLREEVSAIMPIIRNVDFGNMATGEIDDYGTFETRLITTRNYLMADRAQHILAKGNAFIAVGALHLPGEEGLVELLRKDGYTVTRIPLS